MPPRDDIDPSVSGWWVMPTTRATGSTRISLRSIGMLVATVWSRSAAAGGLNRQTSASQRCHPERVQMSYG